MDTQTFYKTVGGDYNEIMARLMTEERVLRFVRKFPADGSYALLKQSLSGGNQEEAFRAAHTLKGVAQNLGFNALYEKAAAVTEILRGGSMEVAALMPAVDEAYKTVIDAIPQIDG
ncbi:MAG: Hpt domain-containing protein [Clostridia bacterium]|nr:Hpt domain-containing protein [Clostridia bacterium]